MVSMVMSRCSAAQALAPTMTAKSHPKAQLRRVVQAEGIRLRVAAEPGARKRAWLALCACSLLAVSTGVARAQALPTDAGTPQTAGPPPPAADARRPPEIVRLEPILIEDAELVSTDTLEVFVRIGADGAAELDDERPSGALRDAIESALANSEFRPAEVDGKSVDARVRIAWQLAAKAEPEPEAPEPPEPTANPRASTGPGGVAPPVQLSEESVSYGATGKIQLLQPTRKHFEPRELRELPGAFGDPFRLADALPGVVPALSGLPYVYVRGSPPASTNYYYDDIQVPILYHLALGPAVVHPALIGTGGLLRQRRARALRTPHGRRARGRVRAIARPTAAFGGELELRLIDVIGHARPRRSATARSRSRRATATRA